MFYIGEGPITTRVFEDAEGFTNGDIGGFAQEADDARAVIQYMHNWPVPGEYETARVCDEAADTFYDVSISDVSGLQVPVRMVADTEGREGTVTVSNAGPADADVSLMVIGEYEGADGAETVAMLRVVDGVVTEDPIFEEAEVILLRAGRSASFVFFFSMDEATTIEWTATAEAEFDVNLDNNTVEAETVVRATKGGGGEG